MLALFNFIDVAPDPVRVGIGVVAVVVLFVIGFVMLLLGALVLFLWLRKRRLRNQELAHPADSAIN